MLDNIFLMFISLVKKVHLAANVVKLSNGVHSVINYVFGFNFAWNFLLNDFDFFQGLSIPTKKIILTDQSNINSQAFKMHLRHALQPPRSKWTNNFDHVPLMCKQTCDLVHKLRALLHPLCLQWGRLNSSYPCVYIYIWSYVIIISQLSFLPHNRQTLQHIVDEEAILQLMKNCPMCNRKCRCSKHTRGPYLIVYQSCYFCHYQRKWASQPEARNMNTHKTRSTSKRKLQPKDKVCAKVEAQSSQLSKKSISEHSVSEADDPLETWGAQLCKAQLCCPQSNATNLFSHLKKHNRLLYNQCMKAKK